MVFVICCPLRAADGYQWRRAPAIMAAGCARARNRRKHHSGCVDRRLVPFGGGLSAGRTCTLPLAQSHLHSPTCTSPLAHILTYTVPLAQSHWCSPTGQSSWYTPTCTLPLAYSPLHIPTGAVPRADTSHQLMCTKRQALARPAEANLCRRLHGPCRSTCLCYDACCIGGLPLVGCMLRVASCRLHLASCILPVVGCSQCGRRRPFSAR